MITPQAEEAEPVPQLPLPTIDNLSKWQLAGWVCAWCPELLLLVPRLRLGIVYDADGWPHDVMACEPCVVRAVQKVLADAP